jgi:hypothetical protein
MDTGIFDDDKYFDVFIEYAKADVNDICIKITATNRGRETAPLHILPTIWFRIAGRGMNRRKNRKCDKRNQSRKPFFDSFTGRKARRLFSNLRRREKFVVYRKRN